MILGCDEHLISVNQRVEDLLPVLKNYTAKIIFIKDAMVDARSSEHKSEYENKIKQLSEDLLSVIK